MRAITLYICARLIYNLFKCLNYLGLSVFCFVTEAVIPSQYFAVIIFIVLLTSESDISLHW